MASITPFNILFRNNVTAAGAANEYHNAATTQPQQQQMESSLHVSNVPDTQIGFNDFEGFDLSAVGTGFSSPSSSNHSSLAENVDLESPSAFTPTNQKSNNCESPAQAQPQAKCSTTFTIENLIKKE